MTDYRIVDLKDNKSAIYATSDNGLEVLQEKMGDWVDRIHDGQGNHGWKFNSNLKDRLIWNLGKDNAYGTTKP